MAVIALLNSVVGCLFAFIAIRKTCNFFHLRWFLALLGNFIFMGIIGVVSFKLSAAFFSPGLFRALGAASIYVPVVVGLGFFVKKRYWHVIA
jgi:hypothetical protein